MASSPSAQASIAPSAIVDQTAVIGEGTRIWAFVQIAEHAVIGKDCVIGNGAYIDRHVRIGDRVRIHNKALLYQGVVIGNDVFVGPGVCFTNDRWPKSGSTRNMKGVEWKVGNKVSIGANATILPDLSIGEGAVIGAGSLVTKSVPSHVLVYGSPAQVRGLVCECGHVVKLKKNDAVDSASCPACSKMIQTKI